MLVEINANNDIVGYSIISSEERKKDFLNSNPSYIEVADKSFDEPLPCYTYANGVVSLKTNWETVKAGLPENTPPLDVVRTLKLREINKAYEAEMNALVAEYPETERESWGKQESEARAWLTDNTAPTPFIDAMLLVDASTTKTQLVNRIIAKSDALADATGQLTGKRHVKEAEIEAAYLANDQTALENITW